MVLASHQAYNPLLSLHMSLTGSIFLPPSRPPSSLPPSSKLWVWALRQYARIVFMDTDHLVLHALDDLFSMPELTAQMNLFEIWNSGLFVVEPSECTFRLILDSLHVFEGFPICDQVGRRGGGGGGGGEEGMQVFRLCQLMPTCLHVVVGARVQRLLTAAWPARGGAHCSSLARCKVKLPLPGDACTCCLGY